jgi:hemerythrin-like metal-binding protein
MDKIKWTYNFSVGISFLDEEHRQIIDMINKLIERSNTHNNREAINEILTDLRKYALTHFNDEERIMDENNYPECANHKELHKEFNIKVVSFHSAIPQTEDTLFTNILEFLKNWWIQHILHEDMKYKEFYNKNGLLNRINEGH